MRKALDPRQERDDSVNHVTDFSDTSDSTPINSQVAEIRNAVARLKLEIELCEVFLKSGNITDGPSMDKPVEEVKSRVNQVRAALKEICALDISNPEFERNFRQIKNGIFAENI